MSQFNVRKTNRNVWVNLVPQNKLLSKYSMKLCVSDLKRNGNSLAWKYYGLMYDQDGTLIAKDRYYCQPCLSIQQKCLDEGKADSITHIHNIASTTSSGNLKPHLLKMHNIDIDCNSKQERKRLLLNWCSSSEAKAAQSSYDINRDIWFSDFAKI